MNKYLDFYKGKKILVVGAFGYLGQKLSEELDQAKAEIQKIGKTDGDITSTDFWKKLFSEFAPDIIFYMAANESRNPDPILDLNVNAVSILHCLEEIKTNNLQTVIVFASSANLVGVVDNLPVNENTKDNPLTIYATHKLLAENYLNYYRENFKIPSITLRLTNIYGPSVDVEVSQRVVINKMVLAGARGQDLFLYANKSLTRDFLYITDAVNAFLLAGQRVKQANKKYYVLGSGEKTSFSEIADKILTICKEQGKDLKINNKEDILPLVEMREFLADALAFKTLTAWNIGVGLDNGLKETFEYFRNNLKEKIQK